MWMRLTSRWGALARRRWSSVYGVRRSGKLAMRVETVKIRLDAAISYWRHYRRVFTRYKNCRRGHARTWHEDSGAARRRGQECHGPERRRTRSHARRPAPERTRSNLHRVAASEMFAARRAGDRFPLSAGHLQFATHLGRSAASRRARFRDRKINRRKDRARVFVLAGC